MSNVVYRRAKKEDRAELLTFWKKAYLDSFPYLKKRHAVESMDAFYDDMIEKGNEFHLAHDGSIVGMCAILKGHIQYLYVKTEDQRKGIGTSLLGHLFRSYPSERFHLYVYQQNTEAIKLYKKLGFHMAAEHISKFEQEPSFRMEKTASLNRPLR